MARLEHLLVVLAAVVCLLFVSTVRDTPGRRLGPVARTPPPLPAQVGDRDARLSVLVTDADGLPVAGARAHAMAIRDDKAYLAGAATTGKAGDAVLEKLPRGETWVLVEGEGHARASTRLVLDGSARALKLRLFPAHALDLAVVDDANAPVVGAAVEVRSGDPLPFIATTGDDGRAHVDRLGPPTWTVKVAAQGYDGQTHAAVTAAMSPLKVVLKKLGAIEVAVIGADGKPAPKAWISAVGPGLWPARRTETDAEGRARIAGLARGVYDLRATRGDEVAARAESVSLGRGEIKAVKLELVAGRRVTVKVTDGEGDDAAPVPAAAIVLAEGGLSSFPLEASTDKGGIAVVGPIAPGDATVSARAPGFVSRTGVAVPRGASPTVPIALVRGGALEGEVVDARGFPVDGATIEVVGTDLGGAPIDETPELVAFRAAHFAWALDAPREMIRSGELGVMAGPIPPIPHGASAVPEALLRPGGDTRPPDPWVTRGDGTFRAWPVPPGRVRAIVRHPAYVEALSELVTVAPGGEAHVRVVMRGGGSLEGRVLDARQRPVSGARVDLAATRGTLERTTLTADDGTFGFAAVPAEIVVSVTRPESPDDVATRLPVSVKEGERKEIEIVLGELRDPMQVRVQDEHRDGLDNAQISVVSLSRESPLRRTVFTDKEGHAEVKDAVGLALRVEVTLPGRAPVVRQLDAAPAELVVELARGMTATGVVTSRRGHDAVEGASVTLYAGTATRHARTDDQGGFHLEDLPTGPARLLVVHAGHAKVEREVVIDGSSPDRPVVLEPVDLADAGNVEGVVEDKRGDPIVGARVAEGTVPTFLPTGRAPRGIATTDKHGRFALDDLPEGEVVLEAFSPDLGRAKETVRVVAGRTTTRVRIVLDGSNQEHDTTAPAGVAVTLGERGAGGSLEVVVVQVAQGSEAERAGVLPGDRIATVDGEAPKSMQDARERLSGPAGDDVVVELERADGRHKVRVAREAVRR